MSGYEHPHWMLPSRLYVIVDAQSLAANGATLGDTGAALRKAGVRLLQYRDKQGTPQQILNGVMALRDAVGHGPCVILNDHPDLAALAGVHGAHVGQSDVAAKEARRMVGPANIVGVSTHTDDQIRRVATADVDYVAFGPVFPTATKLDPEPVVGLEGVRRARALTSKPFVAIGGITRENARSVMDAGADAVAIISALFDSRETVEQVARDFLAILR